MHDTAFTIGSKFLELHAADLQKFVLELGSQNINGTLRNSCGQNTYYLGLDMEHGLNVDVVISPDTPLPVKSSCVDLAISSSQMEHDRFFWTTFLELLRVLKPGGLLYMNAPSNGAFHRFPRDMWRFYPDAGHALTEWGSKNGYDIRLVESFIARRQTDPWNDFVAVFKKDRFIPQGTPLISNYVACENVQSYLWSDVCHISTETEDQRIIGALSLARETLEARASTLQTSAEQSIRLEGQLTAARERAESLALVAARVPDLEAEISSLRSGRDEALQQRETLRSRLMVSDRMVDEVRAEIKEMRERFKVSKALSERTISEIRSQAELFRAVLRFLGEKKAAAAAANSSTHVIRLLYWIVTLQYGKRMRAERVIRQRMDMLSQANIFDRNWYEDTYPDVIATGMDPLRHFCEFGLLEGRRLGPAIDEEFLLRLSQVQD